MHIVDIIDGIWKLQEVQKPMYNPLVEEQNMLQLKNKFNKVINFMNWSQVEERQLLEFENTLCRELMFTEKQFIKFLSALKIDYQLYNELIKAYQEITANINSYSRSNKNKQQYEAALQTKAYLKINLLMKTATAQIKVACESVNFLHFISCNLSNYNKIIRQFEAKRIFHKIQEKEFETSFIIKQKLYSIVSIIYIKMTIEDKDYLPAILQEAVEAREAHLKVRFAVNSSKNQHRQIIKNKPFQKEYLYESLTIFLANAHTDVLWKKILKNPTSSSDIYQLLALLSKYCKKFTEKGSQKLWFKYITDNFIMKISDIKNKALKILDKLRYEGYNVENQEDKQDSTERRKVLSANCPKRAGQMSEQKLKCPLKEQLAQKFFKNIDKSLQKKDRCKTAFWLKRGSTSKTRDRVLAYTFENAKNALRRIQFQMKANNNIFLKERKDSAACRLNKKKMRKDIYEKFKGNKKILVDISSNKLDLQIASIERIKIWSPTIRVEEVRKIILDHKVVHKDGESYGKKKRFGMDPSQKFSVIQIMKYIEGVPRILNVRIKPKEKNYHIKVDVKIINQNFTFELSLPKSTNIFTDRFQTIWPTIKYLIKKKMMRYRTFKDYEDCFAIWQHQFQDQNLSKEVKEDKINELFGVIHEQELFEISGALGILGKFVDLMFAKNRGPSGWRRIFQEMNLEQNEKVCLFGRGEDSHLLIKQLEDKSDKGLQLLRASIQLSSEPVPITIGFYLLQIKQLINLIEDSSSNYDFMNVIIMSDKLIATIIGHPLLQIQVTIEKPSQYSVIPKKQKFKRQSSILKIKVEEILKRLKIGIIDFTNKITYLLYNKKMCRSLHKLLMGLCFEQLQTKEMYYSPYFYIPRSNSSNWYRKNIPIFSSVAGFAFTQTGTYLPSKKHNQIVVIENYLGFSYDDTLSENGGKDLVNGMLLAANQSQEVNELMSNTINSLDNTKLFIPQKVKNFKPCQNVKQKSIDFSNFTVFNFYRQGRHMQVKISQMVDEKESMLKIQVKSSINKTSADIMKIPEEKVFEAIHHCKKTPHIPELFHLYRSTIIPKLAICVGKQMLRNHFCHKATNLCCQHTKLMEFQTNCQYLRITPFRLFGFYTIFSLRKHSLPYSESSSHQKQFCLEFQIQIPKKIYKLSANISMKKFKKNNRFILTHSCLQELQQATSNLPIKKNQSEHGQKITGSFEQTQAMRTVQQLMECCKKQNYGAQSLQHKRWNGDLQNPLYFHLKLLQKFDRTTMHTFAVFYQNDKLCIGKQFLKSKGWSPTIERAQEDFQEHEYLIIKILSRWENFELKRDVRVIIEAANLEIGVKISLQWLALAFLQSCLGQGMIK